jgi:CRP/FNR family nitrogen fixation transcriptional regulator
MTLAFALHDPRTARPPSALVEVIERQGARARVDRNEELYAQNDDVELLYRIVRGVVRTTRVGLDGRRQVGGFYYPGDILGLETGPQHLFAAEALTAIEAQVLRRSAVRAFAGDTELDRAILDATRLELERAQSHMLVLGLKNAREKVAAFLLSLAQSSAGDERASTFELAMSRQDMADYLGLTIETVSRMLGQLQNEALVEFPTARQFRVPRRDALEALAV